MSHTTYVSQTSRPKPAREITIISRGASEDSFISYINLMRFCSNLEPLPISKHLCLKAAKRARRLRKNLIRRRGLLTIRTTDKQISLQPESSEYLSRVLSGHHQTFGISHFTLKNDLAQVTYVVQVFIEQ